MKTQQFILTCKCPYCKLIHAFDIKEFKYDPERNVFTKEWVVKCRCEIDFFPTIYLDEFKEV